jgi:hypothetical protein
MLLKYIYLFGSQSLQSYSPSKTKNFLDNLLFFNNLIKGTSASITLLMLCQLEIFLLFALSHKQVNKKKLQSLYELNSMQINVNIFIKTNRVYIPVFLIYKCVVSLHKYVFINKKLDMKICLFLK